MRGDLNDADYLKSKFTNWPTRIKALDNRLAHQRIYIVLFTLARRLQVWMITCNDV